MAEERILAQGSLDTGGSDATRRLSGILKGFSNLAGAERREVVKTKSLAAGLQAGREGKLPTKSEFSIANQAFNNGLRSSYLAETDGDIRENISRLTQENSLNPEGFETGVLAMEEGLLSGIEDDELRAGIQQNIRQRGEAAFLSISNAKRDHDNAISWNGINNEIDELTRESQEFASDGDNLGSATSMLKAFNFLDTAVDSGLIDLETAAKRKRLIERDATIESLRFDTREDFDSLDSFGGAMQRLEAKDAPNGFTQQEWIDTKDQIESDLKNSIDREQLDEANNDKILDAEQKSNFNQAYGAIVDGTLDSLGIRAMEGRGEITGTQMKTLLDRSSSKGKGVDMSSTLNEIERKFSVNDLNGARALVNANWGTNLSDATARSLLGRIDDESDPDSLISGPNVNQERNNMKTMLGFQDQFSQFFDPAAQQRVGSAVDQFNQRVLNGEDPRAVKFDLIEKNATPTQRFDALRNPKFSDNKDDMRQSAINLQKAFKAGNITKGQLDMEINYLRNKVSPALELKNAYEKMVSGNSKQVKAGEE